MTAPPDIKAYARPRAESVGLDWPTFEKQIQRRGRGRQKPSGQHATIRLHRDLPLVRNRGVTPSAVCTGARAFAWRLYHA